MTDPDWTDPLRPCPPRRPAPLGRTAALALALAAALVATGPALAQMPTGEFPKTDFENQIVDITEITSGGPPRDGIPSIDVPRHVTTEEAAGWLDPGEPGDRGRDRGRGPRLPASDPHLARDRRTTSSGGCLSRSPSVPSAIPPSSSIAGFGGDILDFGHHRAASGLSDLVMYDRQTETWWQQLTGTGSHRDACGGGAGPTAGEHRRLGGISVRVSGCDGSVPRDRPQPPLRFEPPIRANDSSTQPFLLRGTPDPRLPAMERVLHVAAGGTERIYPVRRVRAGTPHQRRGWRRAGGRDQSGRDALGARQAAHCRFAPDPLRRRLFAAPRRARSRVRSARRQGRRHRHRVDLELLRRGGGRRARRKPARAALARRALRVRVARISPRRGRVRRPRIALIAEPHRFREIGLPLPVAGNTNAWPGFGRTASVSPAATVASPGRRA